VISALSQDDFFAHVLCVERNFFNGLVEARIAIPFFEGLNFGFGFSLAKKLIDAFGKILAEQEEATALVLQEEVDFVIFFRDDNFAFHLDLPP